MCSQHLVPPSPTKSISYGWEKVMGFHIIFPDFNRCQSNLWHPHRWLEEIWESSDHHRYRIVIYWRSGGFQTSGGYVGLLSSFLQRIAWALVSSRLFSLRTNPRSLQLMQLCTLFTSFGWLMIRHFSLQKLLENHTALQVPLTRFRPFTRWRLWVEPMLTIQAMASS